MATVNTGSTWADLEVLGPESGERAYRRGYRAGWMVAVEAMHDLMFADGLPR